MKNREDYIFNNKIKIILILILVFNILLMIFLIFQQKGTNKQKRYENMQFISQDDMQGTFVFENSKEILSIALQSEDLSAGDISKKIEDYAIRVLPLINEEILKAGFNNIPQVYKNKKDFLLNHAGIESEKELTEICDKLKNVECNLSELKSASFISDTIDYKDNIFKVNVKLLDSENKYITLKLTYNVDSIIQYEYEIV